MTYSALDNECQIASDDMSHNAFELCTLRDNAAEIHAERETKTSVAFPLAQRLCGIRPTCLGPFLVFLGQQTASLTVRLRVDAVALDGTSDGTDAIYVWCGAGNRSMVQPPPRLSEDDWTLLTRTSTAQTLVLEVPLTHSLQSGWVGVYVWYRSALGVEEEDGTGLTGVGSGRAAGSVELGAGGVVFPSTTNPPERALRLTPRIQGIAGQDILDDIGSYFLIAKFKEDAEDNQRCYLQPWPSVSSLGGDDISETAWEIWTIGVLVLNGISIEQNPGTFYPLRESFHINRPVRWQTHQGLIQGINSDVDLRVPTHLCYPGFAPDEGQTRAGLIRHGRWDATNAPGADELDGTWRVLARCFVPFGIKDGNGYTAIVSVASLFRGSTGDDGTASQIILRLHATEIDGTSIIAGSEGRYDLDAMSAFSTIAGGYNYLKHTMFLWTHFAAAQVNGQLSGLEDYTEDIRRLHHYVIELDEDATFEDNPFWLTIEAKQDPALVGYSVAVFGAGVASRMKVEA